jgi:medium-chain acyl-[acyl-carrier-protein] hydrolase
MSNVETYRSRWLASTPSGDQLRLLCFPHAGGMAHMFRDWAHQLYGHIEVCPVQLPGRGARLGEPAHRDIHGLVETACAELLPHLGARFALFGHSMGAVVAFELARALSERHGRIPERLFVSAHRAPGTPARRPPIHALPDPAFIAELVRMRGTPPEVAANAELMQLLLPVLRADLEAIETYRPSASPPLACPIIAFVGDEDPLISAADLTGWRSHTTGRFALHVVRGDHFFVNTNRHLVLEAIGRELVQENCHASVEPAYAHRAPRSSSGPTG